MFSVDKITPSEKVNIPTPDGTILVGQYYPGTKKSTLILLHGLGSAKEEWLPFTKSVIPYGYNVLYYDLRGHGESVNTKSGRKLDYRNFRTVADWEIMVPDLETVVKYLHTQKHVPKEKIGLLGASLGANVCLLYAIKDKQIPVVLLLSPGLNYAGLQTENMIEFYGTRRIMFVAAPGDQYAYTSSTVLYQKCRQNRIPAQFIVGDGNFHGVQMFTPKLTTELVQWLKKYFP